MPIGIDMERQGQTYIPEIDGLRAIAVLSVMVYHIHANWLPGGFVGVDIFFVISGYVVSIAASLYIDGKTALGFIKAFYIKRIARIVPALVLMLVVTALFSVLFIPSAWLSRIEAEAALAAVFGFSNFILIANDGYFDPVSEFNSFTHTWSLAVEEQFYFLFPILFFLWWRARRGKAEGGRRALLITGLALASLAYCIWASYATPELAFFMMPARFWELALGVLIAQWHINGGAQSSLARRRTLQVGLPLGLALLAVSFVVVQPDAFPFPGVLLPVLGTGLILAALPSLKDPQIRPAGGAQTIGAVLRAPLVAYVGKISYPLYLWHWPVIVLLRWTIGMEQTVSILLAFSLPFVFAILSYHLMERPVRRWMSTGAATGLRAFGVGATLAASSAGLIAFMFFERHEVTLSVTADRETWYITAPMRQSAGSGTFSDRQVFVLGDSHALAYRNMVSEAAAEMGFAYRVLHDPCGHGRIVHAPRSTHGCEDRLSEMLTVLEKRAQPGDILMLANLRVPRRSEQIGQTVPDRWGPPSLQPPAALLKTADALGLTVLVDLPKPVFNAPPFRCSDWFNRTNPICSPGFSLPRTSVEVDRAQVVQILTRFAARTPNAVIWDPLGPICSAETCDAYTPSGTPIFFDGDHLGPEGNSLLVRDFTQTLARTWQSGVNGS